MASGATLPFWGVYNYFPFDDASRATEYPIMRGIVGCGRRLPAEADNGILLPATLDKTNMALQWDRGFKNSMGLDASGKWQAWVVIAPATALYRLRLQTTAGGTQEIEVDGRSLAAPAPSGGD